jgi:hypothetical protein
MLWPHQQGHAVNPRKKPATTRGGGRTPPALSQSTNTIHNETVATSKAAMPEGTIRSDQETVPLPRVHSRPPTMNAVVHWGSVGLSRVIMRSLGYKAKPANRYRNLASK